MVPNAGREDGTMVRTDDPMQEPTPLTAEEAAAAVRGGTASVADIARRLTPYFARAEPRQRALAYRRGLLSPAERKHSWPLAAVSGAATP
jgi:hypothetical protein